MYRIKGWTGVTLVLLTAAVFARCKNGNDKNRVAGYVGDSRNGLIKKQTAAGNDITCQFVPEKQEGASPATMRFMVLVKTTPEQTTDSVLYQMNYHSSELFGLVRGGDTLKPVLSERMANGRRDVHSFMVLFETPAGSEEQVLLLLRKNRLLPANLTFEYQYKDISKALKTL